MLVWLLQCLMIALLQLPDGSAKSLWYGEMDAGERLFRFVVTAELSSNGAWQAELKSLDEGGANFKLDEFTLNETDLSFQLKQTKASYAGKLDNSSSSRRASGNWSQNGGKFKLNFRQVDVVPVDHPSETWFGEMQAGLQKLSMQIRIYTEENGQQRVYFDSLAQAASGFKGKLKRDGNQVEFEFKSLAAKLSGRLNSDGNEIDGKWKQGVASLDLVLKKTDRPHSTQRNPPKRPQTPQAPFPYDVEEVVFENSRDGIKFSGTLTIPHSAQSNQRFPVALLVSGSGPQDRDETIFGHKPFWVLADHLSRHGFAVLRYDDRGVGKSGGKFENATTVDFAHDAASAIEYLKAHSKIDPKRIGIIGHSEGGLVAPIVASQDAQVAWVVLLAGPGVNGLEIMYSQGRLIIMAAGGDEATAQRNRLIQDAAYAATVKLEPGESLNTAAVDPLVEQVLEQAKTLKLGPTGDNKSAEENEAAIKKLLAESIRANVAAMNTKWFRFFMSHEPGPVLEKVRCPVLAINGEKDVQVDPKLNLPQIEASLKAGGNTNVTMVELPGLNHLLQSSSTGALGEYEVIEETIAPIALDTISQWLQKQTH